VIGFSGKSSQMSNGWDIPYAGASSPGFFELLERKITVNPHSVGFIRIRATDPCMADTDRLWLICSKHGSGSYISLNIPNSYVQIDLRKYRVHPTHYLLESEPLVQMRSLCWVVEGSDNGCKWECLDERRLARPPEPIAVYRCRASGFRRFIRLRQTGLNSVRNHQLAFRRLELFGNVEYRPESALALESAGFV
jgi:hypothetical protein